jgi:hypothetical protein
MDPRALFWADLASNTFVWRKGFVVEPSIFVVGRGGRGHTHRVKYHDEIISLAFIRTKYGAPIVIMVFRRAMQKVTVFDPP